MCKRLTDQGAELFRADVHDPASLRAALEGCHGVYLVTFYWEHMDAKKEEEEVLNVAKAAKEAGEVDDCCDADAGLECLELVMNIWHAEVSRSVFTSMSASQSIDDVRYHIMMVVAALCLYALQNEIAAQHQSAARPTRLEPRHSFAGVQHVVMSTLQDTRSPQFKAFHDSVPPVSRAPSDMRVPHFDSKVNRDTVSVVVKSLSLTSVEYAMQVDC